MISLRRIAGVAFAATGVTTLAALGQSPPYVMKWAGAQREVMRGDLTPHIALGPLTGAAHLYAVGPLDQLQGEITIWDGQPSIARIRTSTS